MVTQFSAAPAPLPAHISRPPLCPFVPLRAATFFGTENPETFINDLDRHYQLNSVYTNDNLLYTDDNLRRIDKACTAMSRAAGIWFDNLAKSHPKLLVAYSAFLAEACRVTLSALRLDNPLNYLLSFRMTGSIRRIWLPTSTPVLPAAPQSSSHFLSRNVASAPRI